MDVTNNDYKNMKTLYKDIKIPALKGTKTIAEASGIFTGWIDSDFKNWETDVKGKSTKSMTFQVNELTENMTFNQMFPDPEKMCMTQEQILWYVENNKDKINDGYTFFLFKVGDEFFVAYVRVDDVGTLDASVYRFSDDYVWDADRRFRVVVPATSVSDPLPDLTLSPSETLESRIEALEEFRKKVEGFLILK